MPLDGNADPDTFKVYMSDMGLFVSMLEDGTQYDILQGDAYDDKRPPSENPWEVFFDQLFGFAFRFALR